MGQLDDGKHHSNSYLEFMKNKITSFGQIVNLFVPSNAEDVWFVIQTFKGLQCEEAEDPYKRYPELNIQVVSKELNGIVLLREKEIVGHVAVLNNPPRTFGYPFATMTMVSLAQVVSGMDPNPAAG